MADTTAELIAMRTRRDEITAERDLLSGPEHAARVWAIGTELDSMDARLDELGVGDLPGDRDWTWHDGVITLVDDDRDHLLVGVRLSDGTKLTASLITGGEDDGTFEQLLTMQDQPARLRLGRLGANDRNHPARIDRSLPLLQVVSTARGTFPSIQYLREGSARD